MFLENIILDPIFIFIFKWGMMGAAVATVIGQILTAVLSVWYLCHMKAIHLERSSFKWYGNLIPKFLTLGVSSFLAQVSLVFSMAAVQNMCTKYGAMDPVFGQAEYAQIPLAALGIVMKFFQIAISISVGIAAGCIPIVGYNIGANRKDRAKTLFTYLLRAEFVVGLVALIIVECFPLQIANIFGVFLPIILPMFFGLDGILYSFPVADVLTFIIAIFFIRQTYRELSDNSVKPKEK